MTSPTASSESECQSDLLERNLLLIASFQLLKDSLSIHSYRRIVPASDDWGNSSEYQVETKTRL